MTASTMTQATSTGPCGCGATATSGSNGGCGCGCGGNCSCGCSTCQSQSFVRPRFFAGQLLTEDDLQSLVEYVGAKNRLHNRYLLGDGVVCGLTVTCPPCGTGKVTVNPGYALDCCGNDIVVGCPVDLDVNRMVRDLLIKIRGKDCGNPCPDTNANQSAQVKSNARRYCLYIDYCEQSSDPVAPYSTGDACGQSSCEATRIQEGYRFELRCPVDEKCPPGVIGRLRQCLGDEKTTTRMAGDADSVLRYSTALDAALHAVRREAVPVLRAETFVALKKRSATVLERVEAFEARPSDEKRNLAAIVTETSHIAASLARIHLQAEFKIHKDQEAAIADGEEALEAARRLLSKELIEGELAPGLERARAYALLELAGLVKGDTAHLREAREALRSPTSVLSGRALSLRLLAENVVLTYSLFREISNILGSLREWAMIRMEQSGQTDCSALCNVEAVTLPRPPAGAELGTDDALRLARTGQILPSSVRTVIRNCLCNALIPPCPSCDDAGVLLACLTVEDCKVTEICNIARKFVFSLPAIRYWFPGLACLGDEIDKLCCPECGEGTHGREPGLITGTPRSLLETVLPEAPYPLRSMMSSIWEPGGGVSEFPASLLFGRITTWRAEEQNRRLTLDATMQTVTDLHKRLDGALDEIRALKARMAKRPEPKEKNKPAEERP